MWFFEGDMKVLTFFYGVLGVVFWMMIMGMVLMMLAVIVSQKWRFESDKLTSFECGFDSLSSSRMPFSLRFFLLALLFLVFDLEVILFFPYIFSMVVNYFSMSVMSKVWGCIFLMILVLGLIHELNEGTLDWEME
uniref:NADH dehydrogenase subunit 3 n=1 Tax=Marcia recens TaxID=2490373 RepID=UPI002237FFC9|nr:NADH dehydrogenase subunit 3 [Marcia recens]UYR95116.1 NADH dehydrogenase subunit 3 [Marcia recens]